MRYLIAKAYAKAGIAGVHSPVILMVAGAEPAMTFSQYHDKAIQQAKLTQGDFVVVALDLNALNPIAQAFPTKQEAADSFARVSEKPGVIVYVALFDKTDPHFPDVTGESPQGGAPIEEGFFVAQTEDVSVVTKTVQAEGKASVGTKSVAVPVVAGVGAAALILSFILKK
jgi:hypothetical protein